MDKTVGANALRGGKHTYSSKTLTSHWTERGRPLNGRWTTSRFVTTAMEMGASGKAVATPVFGAGLPAKPIVAQPKIKSSKSSGLSPEALEAYRAMWTR